MPYLFYSTDYLARVVESVELSDLLYSPPLVPLDPMTKTPLRTLNVKAEEKMTLALATPHRYA